MSRCILFILLFFTQGYLYAGHLDTTIIQVQTSNKKLEQAFKWAVEMALSHVQTGK